MIKITLLALFGGALFTGAAIGGESWCPPSYEGKGVTEECDACPEYRGHISGGYHSDYIWRGFQFADETWTADISYRLPTGDALGLPFGDIEVGALYIQSLPQDYEETQLFANLYGPTVFGIDTVLNYRNYDVAGLADFAGLDDRNELGITLSRNLFGSDVSYFVAHDFGLNAWYQELRFGRTIPLTDNVALQLESAAGYWDISGVGQTGFSHRKTTLSLPIQCGCQLRITPYIGYIDTNEGGPTHGAAVGSFNGTNGFGGSPDDQWYGGVNVGWSF